ncbi:MAG: hypothetical protein JWP37_2747 [Mucilaginibacter sp.]|nr:hypothetical protein [Mucilaginibacter sp.]
MNKRIYIFSLIAICAIIAFHGCRKPYLPPAISLSGNYLVVEGVINTGNDSTIVKLSRVVKLSSSNGSNPELNAKISIESDANASYPLAEAGGGRYVIAGLNLSAANKYHLKIVTSDNKTYQSDFVPVKNSPPIDSVYYLVKGNNLQINADTHDPANSTIYYRWEFTDAWEFHSAYNSFSIVSHDPFDTILFRTLSQQIYTCYKGSASTNIILNSSEKLSKDIITGNAVNLIPSTSEKIGIRYSILVKQYALTKEAYKYWQQLKKNTEQLGSIFDAQPSEISGNIHCVTNPSEPVIGYISAGTAAQTRIFINTRSLPAWRATTPYDQCTLDSLYFSNPKTGNNDVRDYIYTGFQLPVYPLAPPGGKIVGYAASTPECVDCTLRGSSTPPSFWINQ